MPMGELGGSAFRYGTLTLLTRRRPFAPSLPPSPSHTL